MKILFWYIQSLICRNTLNENIKLKEENTLLQKKLLEKGNIFFKEHKWLGISKIVFGTVEDGKLIVFHEADSQ